PTVRSDAKYAGAIQRTILRPGPATVTAAAEQLSYALADDGYCRENRYPRRASPAPMRRMRPGCALLYCFWPLIPFVRCSLMQIFHFKSYVIPCLCSIL